MAENKYVYFFGGNKTEGRNSMKDLLGGKGANLAEMANLGIPVPPGFTITAEVCVQYLKDNVYPAGLLEQIDAAISRLEEVSGKTFGNDGNPLLVSVRSGARVSMPGMMDTVLNLGMNDESAIADCLWCILVLAKKYEVDIEKEFLKTMDELEKRIENN